MPISEFQPGTRQVRFLDLLATVDAAGHSAIYKPVVYNVLDDGEMMVLIAADASVPRVILKADTFNRWLARGKAAYVSW